MSIKLVIGLTDVDGENFYPTPDISESYTGPVNLLEKIVYTLPQNDTAVEKAFIEWELDTTLPAVNNLLNILDVIKSKLNITRVYYHKYSQVLPGLFDTDFILEFKNLIPNTGLILSDYTDIDYENVITNKIPIYCSIELDATASVLGTGLDENETLFHAMESNNTTFLVDGPMRRVVTPTLLISFVNNDQSIKNKSMSIEQQQWMLDNKELLESKGYYMSEVKNKIGALVIGQLIGTYDDAFAKAQQYNRICRVEIVRED